MTFNFCLMISPMSISLGVVVTGLISLCTTRNQLLLSLLSLEASTLGIFMAVAMNLSLMGEPVSLSFYILVFGACEASLGLAILVIITRLGGSDIVVTLSNINC